MEMRVTFDERDIKFRNSFSARQVLKNELGFDSTFVLESMAGPKKDTKTAIVGFNALISLTISGGKITFSGRSELREKIVIAALKIPNVKSTVDGIIVPEDDSIWKVLRSIQDVFDFSEGTAYAGFRFGFFGFLGYDTVRFIEKLPLLIPRDENIKDSHLVIYQGIVNFNIEQNEARLCIANSSFWPALNSDLIAKKLNDISENPSVEIPAPQPSEINWSTNKEDYLEGIQKALDYIAIGDIYQVQLGHEIQITTDLSPEDAYLRLRAINPAPYMYFAEFEEMSIIGASPEVFVKLENSEITMRPLAGTIKKGNTDQENSRAAKTLKSDAKEIAEHIMLVDLCRNDFGRVCMPGTLNVSELLETEFYSHVIHLVSDVSATLAPQYDAYDLISACFPAGTMTGAPKVRAMEIIEEIETSRRGLYAGAVGMIDFTGNANMALCIRTAFHSSGTFVIRASAGAVADSTPEAEWNETLSKLGASYKAITGEEITE